MDYRQTAELAKGGSLMQNMYEIRENCLLIKLPEEIDHHNVMRIRREADRYLCDHRVSQIIFDFEKTRFMDSSGIGLLVGRNEKISFLGGRTIVLHANERIQKLLRLAGIDKELCIYRSEE